MTRLKEFLFTFSLVLLLSSNFIDSAKILSVGFVSTKSHKITYEPLLHELASRNHEVTILSAAKPTKQIKNVREILAIESDVTEELAKFANLFEMKQNGREVDIFQAYHLIVSICEAALENLDVKALLKEKFDLVIVEAYYNECAFGLIHKLNTSSIIVSPLAIPTWIMYPLGGISPPSFVPNVFSGYTGWMNFYQRTINLLSELAVNIFMKYFYQPLMADIYRRKLNDPTIPLPGEILKNVSLVLSNSHFSIGTLQPLLPDIIEVDGMHMRSANPLPKNLESFVNASDGFILFSMGSALKGSTMPENTRKMFINAFSKLKQNVLWKWETEAMADLPPNVKLSQWLPQQDLLGHPNIKAFITHGGFGSTTETVYHGVPIIGIPMFGDQLLNIQRAEAAGFAISLEYKDLTEQTLLTALDKAINDPT